MRTHDVEVTGFALRLLQAHGGRVALVTALLEAKAEVDLRFVAEVIMCLRCALTHTAAGTSTVTQRCVRPHRREVCR